MVFCIELDLISMNRMWYGVLSGSLGKKKKKKEDDEEAVWRPLANIVRVECPPRRSRMDFLPSFYRVFFCFFSESPSGRLGYVPLDGKDKEKGVKDNAFFISSSSSSSSPPPSRLIYQSTNKKKAKKKTEQTIRWPLANIVRTQVGPPQFSSFSFVLSFFLSFLFFLPSFPNSVGRDGAEF